MKPDYLKIALLEYELEIVPRPEAERQLLELGCSVGAQGIYSPHWYESWDRNRRFAKSCTLSGEGRHHADCPHGP